MIIKPVVAGRSKTLHEEGDVDEFFSSGWRVRAKVQRINQKYEDSEPFISSEGYYVYWIEIIDKIEYLGVEMTDEEAIEWKKKQDKERQLKMNLK